MKSYKLKPQATLNQGFIESTLHNYNLEECEFSKYLYKIYDDTGSKYGEEYVHDIDFNTRLLRVLPIGSNLSLHDYDIDRITIFIDSYSIITKAFKG